MKKQERQRSQQNPQRETAERNSHTVPIRSQAEEQEPVKPESDADQAQVSSKRQRRSRRDSDSGFGAD
jgi:hypothetical protein